MFSFTLFSAIVALIHPALADLAPYRSSSEFESGAYGVYPNQTYTTNISIVAPLFNVKIQPSTFTDLSSEPYVLLCVRGAQVPDLAPQIVQADENLTLVWSGNEWGGAYPLRVQEYDGESYLTFWNGTSETLGYGRGFYYMLNASYDMAYKLSAVNATVEGDFHEFQLTDNGTALITIYEPMPYDMQAYGIANGYLMDGVFQEIDIETNDLLFEWKASSAFGINDSFVDPGEITSGLDANNAFDFYHINSVEKDDNGNYLVSGRHTHSISYIDGRTGETIWILGGKRNQFEDLSGGNATNFSWQHDPRWLSPSTISLYDNGATDWTSTGNVTRGMIIQLDTTAMTATLVAVYLSPDGILSASQGSMQLLSNGNVFMGYGSKSAFTEYAPGGEPLWDVEFGVLGNRTVKTSGAMNYRTYKANWTGRPDTDPTFTYSNSSLYMSWNGATDIATWALMSSPNSTNLTSFEYVSSPQNNIGMAY
ncbi:hypothetical protein K402DRAFT_343617 [Aulographum hederae CBS 113979]|uniref:ASST-domain-containing protein n=1 Tax=Aulographum hederae CBS 113979 TaxID=1176131 RepID=A0A6G1GJE7_9PEZI|nr:hypothetical protein K402DRAFT_343617 [Aulographum hederae CBS 113979]